MQIGRELKRVQDPRIQCHVVITLIVPNTFNKKQILKASAGK